MADVRVRRARAVPLALATALVLASCSGSDPDDGGDALVPGLTVTPAPPDPGTDSPTDPGTVDAATGGPGTGTRGPGAGDPGTGGPSSAAPRGPRPGDADPDPGGATTTAVTVRFDRAVSEKRWGDPPFTVSATASPGAEVSYAASGACSGTGTTVRILHAGTCTVRAVARARSGPRAETSMTVEVGRARPVIDVRDRQVAYSRPFAVPLRATSRPPVPLTARVVRGGPGSVNDEACTVDAGTLTLAPGFQLSAACLVEVSARGTSPDWTTPAPVRALVQIGFAQWQVSVPPVGRVDWSSLRGGRLEVPVHEDSGDAFGIDAYVSEGACEVVRSRPASPSPPGTTRYTLELQLPDPAGSAYTCVVEVAGSPLDHAGGNAEDSVTVEVVP